MLEQDQYTVLIVEDEQMGADLLKISLLALYPNLHIRHASTIQEALRLHKEREPQLLFLDIHLPDGNGFQFLDQIKEQNFELVFVTAYQDYAIRAFEYSAMQYLLKPIDTEALEKVLKRFFQHEEKQALSKPNWQLAQEIYEEKLENRIALVAREYVEIVPISDIIRCQAESNYTQFVLRTGKKILTSKSLLHYEKLLSQKGFLRVHDKHLVNVLDIRRYMRGGGGTLVLTNAEEIEVSVRKKDKLMQVLGLL